jgi:hypothetical protein
VRAPGFSGGEELYGLYETGIDPPLSTNRAFTNLVWDTSGPLTGNSSGHRMLDSRTVSASGAASATTSAAIRASRPRES